MDAPKFHGTQATGSDLAHELGQPYHLKDASPLNASPRNPLASTNPNPNDASTGPACAASADLPKPWRTAQAKCILAGQHASLIDDDAGRPILIVSRWALTRSFHTVADVEAWLAQVVGRAA